MLLLSTLAGTIALPGAAVADHGDIDTDTADAPVDTGSVHWTGQVLWMENLDRDKTYQLQRNGDIPQEVRTFRTDHDGDAIVETSDLNAPNNYVVYDPETRNYVTFEDGDAAANENQVANPDDADWTVEEQGLNVTAAVAEVNNEGPRTTTTVAVDSNREGEYAAFVTSSGLSDRELVEIFDLTQDNHDEDGVRIPTGQGDEHALDFSAIDGGNYTLEWSIVDTGSSDSVSIDVTDVRGADADFADAVVEEERGDVAEVTVDLQNTTTANLTMTGDSVDYLANVSVADGSGDGTVTVRFNTYEPTSASSFSAAADGDEVNVTEPVSGEATVLEAGNYDLFTSIGGVEKDVATLALAERRTDGVRIYTLPGDTFGRAGTAAEFAELRSAGELTPSQRIADRDAVLVEINSSGIFGALEAASGDSLEERLISLTNEPDDPFRLTVVQTNQSAKRMDLGETHRNSRAGALNVVSHEANDTLYVSIKTDEAVFERPGDEENLGADVGDRFNATFTVPAAGPLGTGSQDETASATWKLLERRATFDAQSTGGPNESLVFVPTTANGTVTGSTTVAPGTEMTVRARATGESPFLETANAVVSADGTFSATFDLSNVSEGQNFTLTVPDQGFEDDAETAARTGTGPRATVSISDQSSDGSTVVVDSVNVSRGGFVTIHDATLLEGQDLSSVRGTSGYLQPGTHANVEVTLDAPLEERQTVIAMPHLDTNDNQQSDFVASEGTSDGPYTESGQAVTDDASVTIETEAPATETATATSPATPTETATATATDTFTETVGQPGFDLVVSVLALLGAALLALRRD